MKRAQIYSIIFITVCLVLVSIIYYTRINKREQHKASPQRILGYVKDIRDREIEVDDVEWVTTEMVDRIDEIGIDPEIDMLNGFYVYNKSDVTRIYTISESCDIETYVYSPEYSIKKITANEFTEMFDLNYLKDELFWFEVYDQNNVIKISQQYLP